jgi:competence protein ComEC
VDLNRGARSAVDRGGGAGASGSARRGRAGPRQAGEEWLGGGARQDHVEDFVGRSFVRGGRPVPGAEHGADDIRMQVAVNARGCARAFRRGGRHPSVEWARTVHRRQMALRARHARPAAATSSLPMRLLSAALLAFAVGATLLQRQPELPSFARWLGVSFTLIAITIASRRFRAHSPASAGAVECGAARAASAIVVMAAGILGFGYAAWRADLRLADALPPEWEGEDIRVVGIVDDLPQPSERGVRFAFAVERVETAGAVVPARLSLAWYAHWQTGGTPDPVPELATGERWRLAVRLKRPHGTVNPHGFDIEAWLLENGLRATGYVRHDDRNARVAAFAGRAADHVQRARESVRRRIETALPGAAYAGVIVALAIGEQRAIPEDQWRVFNRTGITHLISISGLHVTVFATITAAFVYGAARRSAALTSRVPARKLAALAGVGAAALYVLLAGAQVPAQRTLLMLAVAAVGLWLARPGTASLVWLWALFAVLAWDPWAGLAPGFWLSFGAVGLLLYAGTGRLASVPASRAARLGRSVASACRTQALVTVGLVPLTLALFQQVSLVSPLANALAIPVVSLAVVPLTLLGIVVPIDAIWQAAEAIFAALMGPLAGLGSAPGAVWQQHAPPASAVAVAIAGVAWLAAPRGVPGRHLGLLWLLPLHLAQPEPPPPGTFTMTVLDVGQGLAVAIRTHRHALLYDAGPRYHEAADAGGRIVAPYLRAAGIPRLGAVVVTHQDTDHSGGVLSVLAGVPVDWLASSLAGDHPIVAQRAADHAAALRCTAGQRWEWDGVRFRVLHPTPAHYGVDGLKPNDLSCVVRVDSAWGSVLLTGDIEARSEAELVRERRDELRADVLVVPHHGSLTSSTPPFVAAVAPEIAVFTPGYRNRFGHPRPAVVARYANAGVRVFRTDHDGALTFVFGPGAAHEPQAQRDLDRRYWHDRPVRAGASPLD